MTETRGAPARLDAIDGLRAVSAFLVVAHHCSYTAGTTTVEGWGRYMGRLDVGVSIFFAISGFLLFRPMARAAVTGEPLGSPTAFWRRRFWRIAPSYWLALTVLVALGSVRLGIFREYVLHYTLTQIYHPLSVLYGMSQSWSLATEVSFYLVLPFLGMASARIVRGRSEDQRARRLFGAIVALYVVSIVPRLLIERWANADTVSQELWLTGKLNQFLIGMALAVMTVWAGRSDAVASLNRRLARAGVLWFAGAVALFAYVSTRLGLSIGLTRSSLWREFALNEIYGAIALCLLAPLALAPAEKTTYHRALSWRPVAYLGRISYGVYLWHMMLLSSAGPATWMPWQFGDGRVWTRIAVVSVVTVLIAAANFRFVEEPLARRMTLRPRRWTVPSS